jgi:putative hemolysin
MELIDRLPLAAASPVSPFALDVDVSNPLLRKLWLGIRPAVEHSLGLSELGKMFVRIGNAGGADAFAARVIDELGVSWRVSAEDLARIPERGRCVVVANHPFGAIEGLVLTMLLRRRRPDVKTLANYLVRRIEPLRDMFIFVDPFGGSDSARANLRSVRESLRWLQAEGLLLVFPAGEVAHFDLQAGAVKEPAWAPSLARIVRLARTPVVPVHFRGQNGLVFQVAGALHAPLRTALLPRELLNRRGGVLSIRVGSRLSHRRLAAIEDNSLLVDYLRERTVLLGEREHDLRSVSGPRRPRPVVAPGDRRRICEEIDGLGDDQTLVTDADRVVCWARADQIPECLREIGRVRELTFRLVHEGTLKEIDLDDYDRHYIHLFAYDRREQVLVGAYRFGATDEIIPQFGVRGLYASTLFEIQPALFDRTGPALEMGRSFVAPRFQKTPSALALLWRGIGRYVRKKPRYRYLYGPVSVSNAYSRRSRELLVEFIQAGHMHPWASTVRPRKPFALRRHAALANGMPIATLLQDVEELSAVISDLEADGKGLPILIKQYMKLGGTMLGFNVDSRFSSVLDGLILVDLLGADAKTLGRYLGTEGVAALQAHHGTPGAIEGDARGSTATLLHRGIRPLTP